MGVILLVSSVILLGAYSLVSQPRISPADISGVNNAAPDNSIANTTFSAGLNGSPTVCYSNQCQVVPFSAYYGVARVVLDLSTLPGLTFTIVVNSTLSPAYIEQLQLAFYNGNYNSQPTVASYWKFNSGLGYSGVSNSGAACAPQTSLYVALVPACPAGFKSADPLSNPSIPVGPGNSNAPSAAITVSITGGTGSSGGEGITAYPMTVTALVVAPIGATVEISTTS